jgi:hypothetical protein
MILFAGLAVCAGADEGILFLHFERDGRGVELIRAAVADGEFKARAGAGPIEYEVVNEAGALVHVGRCADPLKESVEYADADEAGRMRWTTVERERGEIFIRVPAGGARKVRFFERNTRAAGVGALSSRRLISVVELPEEPAEIGMRAASGNAKVSMVESNGPPALRVNFVFLAEGYTASQEKAFLDQAQVVFNQMMNVSPYKEYKSHFNAFAIFVPSAEAGSDHPAEGSYRDTYFNSSYGVGALERLITIPPNNWNSNFGDGRGKAFALLFEYVPQYDIPLLLVNDTAYGGSGGVPAIASAHSLSGELALHEIGHSFAGLADEYEEQLSGYPEVEAANTTRETRREFIKWRSWIPDEVPVPTPENAFYQNTIGLFEGAYYHPKGWYRPKLDCRMRNLSKPFCEVCRETHVLTIYSLVEPIPSASPAENNVTVPGGGELELRVDTIEPEAEGLGYTWTIDGETNEVFTGRMFSASFATLGTGTRLVRANVWDATGFLRNDPLGRSSQSRSWLVTVVAETNVPPSISEIADVVLELPQQSSGSTEFTVSDPDTPWGEIRYEVSSSNPELLPSDRIVVAGMEQDLELHIFPLAGKTGEARVTLRVSDGTTQVERSFEVVVADLVTDLVLEPIADQRVFSGQLEIPLSVTRTSTNALFYSGESSNPAVLTSGGIQFLEFGGEARVELHPEPGAVGETTVTIHVTDGVEIASREFVITFLAEPKVLAAVPLMTGEGVRVEFNADISTTMILEYSTDLVFWTAISSTQNETKLIHVGGESRTNAAGYYRVRVVPL